VPNRCSIEFSRTRVGVDKKIVTDRCLEANGAETCGLL
jgi:hypothetical protein